MRQLSRGGWRVVSLVVAMSAAAVAAGAQDAAVRAAIEAGNKKFGAAAAKGDAAAVASLYTTDAEAFPPNSDVVKGRPAIQALFKGFFDSGVTGVELTTAGTMFLREAREILTRVEQATAAARRAGRGLRALASELS